MSWIKSGRGKSDIFDSDFALACGQFHKRGALDQFMRVLMTISAAAAVAVLAGCGPKPSGAPATEEAATSAPPAPAPAAAPAAPEGPSDEEKAKLLASLPAPYNTGDLENGRKRFALCRSCHTITPGGPNMTGPNLYGVFGRKAGSVEKFNYSDAVKNAGFTWDAEKLDQWLTGSTTFLPGTKMPPVVGLKTEKDRIDLIAYLKVETGYTPH